MQNLNNFKEKKIHFIGIGGIGMSALARYFHHLGSLVSGSDKESSQLIEDLKSENISDIWISHSVEKISASNPDFIIYSTAVTNNNPEIIWAKENKKKLLHRSELLELITIQKKLISISGTHGKTTTSAMVAEMLSETGLQPSAIIGGLFALKNTNMLFGNSDYFVAEADESDKSFLKGNTHIGVITNIEPDHLENYPGGFNEIKTSFIEFAKKSLSNSGLVACIDDKNTNSLIVENFSDFLKSNNKKLITYSIHNKNSTIYATKNPESNHWEIYINKTLSFTLKLKTPGKHNILNALAAVGVGILLDLNTEKINQSLENYKGVKRRFQILEGSDDFTIVDDYAHHPTEISATIEAAKELAPKRLLIIVQPHQPTRLKDLWDEFKKSLSKEDDLIFISDVYVARGNHIDGINSQNLVAELNKPNIKYLPGDLNEMAKRLNEIIKLGDLVLIMGAGNITNLGQKLLKSNQTLASNSGNN